MEIHVDVVSVEGEIFSGSASMVFAPAEMGEIGILPNHSPLLTRLNPGNLRLRLADQESEKHVFVSGGLLDIQPHLVTVLADTAERGEDLDEAEAQKAKERAEQELANLDGEKDKETLEQARQKLAEATARLKMAQNLRKAR